MRRRHLFELEDQPWFPNRVRDYATDFLHFAETRFKLHRAGIPVLAAALRTTGSMHIVDLCSGGGGSIPEVLDGLEEAGLRVGATLTDWYPNIQAFERAAADPRITFEREPVDARQVPSRLSGLRTIFNGFHHFRPEDATAVLRSAAEAGQPIAIFEISRRTPRTIIALPLVPIVVMLATPLIRPFRWDRLLWTYLVPLVPLTCLWDGFVSQLRAYTTAELEALGADADARASWYAGQVPIGTIPGTLTYLLGYPAESRTLERSV
jgi:hypothetical protein